MYAWLLHAATEVKKGFGSLKESPRELVVIFVAKAFTSYAYFSLSLVYVLYLSDEFGVGDVAAGWSYGVWGALIILWGVLLGPAIDLMGVRRSLVCSFALAAAGRMLLTVTTSRPLMYFVMYVVVPIGDALGVPVMVIGVKRYTTPTNRAVAFGVFYVVMNVSALINGLVMDFLRVYLCNGLNIGDLGPGHWLNRGNRLIMLTGAIVSVWGLGASLCLREVLPKAAPLAAMESNAPSSAEAVMPARPSRKLGEACKQCASDAWRSLVELVAMESFWKYIVLALFLTNLKQIFRYLDSLLPQYMVRAFGCDAPIGSTYSINPAMIIVMVPVVTALTAQLQHFDAIHYGGYVSALSPLWLVGTQSVAGAVLFVATLSVGEAFWSPRWYDYSMAVAPQGQEGVFGALAAMPLFLAKIPAGLLSGALLASYCPAPASGSTCADSPRCSAADESSLSVPPPPPFSPQEAVSCRGQLMWLVIACVTLTSPLLVTAFRSWLRPRTVKSHASVPSEEGGNDVDTERKREEMDLLGVDARRGDDAQSGLELTGR